MLNDRQSVWRKTFIHNLNRSLKSSAARLQITRPIQFSDQSLKCNSHCIQNTNMSKRTSYANVHLQTCRSTHSPETQERTAAAESQHEGNLHDITHPSGLCFFRASSYELRRSVLPAEWTPESEELPWCSPFPTGDEPPLLSTASRSELFDAPVIGSLGPSATSTASSASTSMFHAIITRPVSLSIYKSSKLQSEQKCKLYSPAGSCSLVEWDLNDDDSLKVGALG